MDQKQLIARMDTLERQTELLLERLDMLAHHLDMVLKWNGHLGAINEAIAARLGIEDTPAPETRLDS